MKTLWLTWVCCLFNFTSTEITGTYQIDSKHSFDSLELKEDGTYTYLSRGPSCWTWNDLTGTWKTENGILFLNYNRLYIEFGADYDEKTNQESSTIVTFEVKNNFGNAIPEFEIKYDLLGYKQQVQKTNKKGIVKFEKYTEMEDHDKVEIKIEYVENGNKTSETIAIQANSDHIILTINSNPKTFYKMETYSFAIDKGNLKAIKFPYAIKESTYKKFK